MRPPEDEALLRDMLDHARRAVERRTAGADVAREAEAPQQVALGRETVDYVANINKYYLAYRLQYEATQARQTARSAS